MHPNDGRVVSNFIVQALSGRPLTIYGRGTQTRSFCYVDDLIDGLVRLMRTTSNDGEPVNLGNPYECSMRRHRRAHRSRSPARRRRSSIATCRSTIRCSGAPTSSLARRLLGWEPTVALDEGLKRTIDYFVDRVTPVPRRPRAPTA